MAWECPSCGFVNNDDDTAEECIYCQAPAVTSEPSHTTTNNGAIVTISLKRSKYWAFLIVSIALTTYATFGIVIPVISTGDFNAIWPATDKRIVRKAMIFFCSIIWLGAIPAIIRCIISIGEFRFFNDRLEVSTFFFSRLRIYYYKDITVNQHGSYRVTIHQRNLPGWKHPLNQLKALYIDGTTFGLSPKNYGDPSKISLALDMLKKSTEFNMKALS